MSSSHKKLLYAFLRSHIRSTGYYINLIREVSIMFRVLVGAFVPIEIVEPTLGIKVEVLTTHLKLVLLYNVFFT